jgi:hypothetical protein
MKKLNKVAMLFASAALATAAGAQVKAADGGKTIDNWQNGTSVGSGERQRMMAKPVLCDTCQGLRCRCCGVLQDWSDSWSPVA